MEKVVILAFLVTLIYCVIKVLEMKYIDKEWKPLREIVKEAIIVFICGAAAGFVTFYTDGKVSDFLNIMTETKVLDTASTQVFTGDPGF